MCSVPGYDASSRVDDLAAELGKQMTSIAIGRFYWFATSDGCRDCIFVQPYSPCLRLILRKMYMQQKAANLNYGDVSLPRFMIDQYCEYYKEVTIYTCVNTCTEFRFIVLLTC